MGRPFIPTAEEVSAKIAVPLREWAGNCHPICEQLLASGLLDPDYSYELTHGQWVGYIEANTMFQGRGPVKHTWIEFVDENGQRQVIDPTRYVFFGEDYHIGCVLKCDEEYASNEDEIDTLGYHMAVFLQHYKAFRKFHELADHPDSALEIMNGFADKVGRVARLVKHNHRNDPKPDWEKIMAKELAGIYNYILMCASYHGVDLREGFETELKHDIADHGGNRNA